MRKASPLARVLFTLACLVVALGAGLYALRERRASYGETVEGAFVDLDAARLKRGLPPDQEYLSAPEGSTFRRPALSREQVKALMPQLNHEATIYHPRQYFGFAPNVHQRHRFPEHPDGQYWVTTNSIGLRRMGEVSASQPELRVLVAGDSHVDGVCNSDESFPALLEEALRGDARDAEVLNAARGGQCPVNYPGTIERYGNLNPDHVIVMFTGANDFLELLGQGGRFQGRETDGYTKSERQARRRALAVDTAVYMSGLHTGHALHVRSEDLPLLEELVGSIIRELVLVARQGGASLTVVFLPPTALVDGLKLRATAGEILGILKVSEEEALAPLRPLGGLLAAACREEGAAFVDLTPHLTPACFWKRDLHLSVVGHRVVRDVLLEQDPGLRN